MATEFNMTASSVVGLIGPVFTSIFMMTFVNNNKFLPGFIVGARVFRLFIQILTRPEFLVCSDIFQIASNFNDLIRA